MTNHLTWHTGEILKSDREQLLNQRGEVIWFTGLSGSGKSTIAVKLEQKLFKKNKLVYRLDGDNIRQGLNCDLTFTKQDRMENIRRVAEVAKLMADAGVIVLVSFITPYEQMREQIKKIIGEESLKIVYVKADIETCRQRDPKGLYERAYNGEIANFTGVSAPYERPLKYYLKVDTEKNSIEACVDILLSRISDEK